MNDLTTTGGKPPSLTDCRLSTELWTLLSSEAPAELEVEAICKVPALHAEAKASVPRLAAVAAPCGADAVRALLQPLVLVYGVGEAARSPAFWKIYREQLAGLPYEALEQAVNDYAGQPGAEFFPKPGPLKAFATSRAIPILKALSRAKRVAQSAPMKPFTPAETAQRRAEVAALMSKFKIGPGAPAGRQP